MPQFQNGSVEIDYLDEGDGAPVILIHGFASNKEVNWVQPGWVRTLARVGYRVVALDNRGHGRSTKLYDLTQYHTQNMAEDVRALMDHLGLKQSVVMGYSMGARITAYLTLSHPDYVRAAILGGLGIKLVDGVGLSEDIATALEADSLTDVTDPTGRAFRAFAEQTKSDLRALAACIRGSRQTLSTDEVKRFKLPVLIAIGTMDPVSGAGAPLAALIPGAEMLDIPDRDHMLAVGDKVYKNGVLAFLEKHA